MTPNQILNSELAKLPLSLFKSVAENINEWYKSQPHFTASPEFTEAMVKAWTASQFVAETCQRNPALLIELYNSGDLQNRYLETTLEQKVANLQPADDNQLMVQLRQFRRREMLRIAWRDLAGWADLDQTLLDLSQLASACVQYALDFLYQQACAKRGTPRLKNGLPQQIVVLGMGKLGAYELNFSSDIDLIFAYPEEGVLADRKATTYGEFFTRLCQNLIKVLDEITVDGFVFRTDIRLRPYGNSGAVIMTFDGMETYYLTQAREWERYAMIKARQIAGDFTAGAQLMAMLNAFVYRRYLDYGAFEELRSIKNQISQELRRKDRQDNIKLGPGGIREVEFIGQAFQLIRGGKEKTLQIREIQAVLDKLPELGLMEKQDAENLKASYRFLRTVENHIQQYQDRQTHDLPTDPYGQSVLAYAMGYADWAGFITELNALREQVQTCFDHIFSVTQSANAYPLYQPLWLALGDEQELLNSLKQIGFSQPSASLQAIRQFKQCSAIRHLTTKGAAVLDRLMPKILSALQAVNNPDTTLNRLFSLFESVAGRNVYLALLAENSGALSQLISLCSASAWLTDYLASNPVLFDELLDVRSLYTPLKRDDLDAQLTTLLADIPTDDAESLMFALRQFKQAQVLKVAAADIMNVIPLMVVSDYLTYIAESIIEQVLARAWQMVTEKHGCPPETDWQAMGFAVLGFGKLGGYELGYGSDLDLVFIYDDTRISALNNLTNGKKPITYAQFYGYLGLKVRHIMDTRLLSGILYEVDLRLRPNGESGLLVTSLSHYQNYLQNQAWTWEHQALVRGRFIAGDSQLKHAFALLRQQILAVPREITVLQTEVRDMRQKMRTALASKIVDQFDIKQGKGGIADIEFIVQFMVLAYSAQYPELTTWTDNIRILATLAECGLLTKTSAEVLTSAYCAYRDLSHKQVLQGNQAIIDSNQVTGYVNAVGEIWQTLLGTDSC